MAINSVDMNRALESASYAQQLCRSGQLSASQKGQLVAKWGNENIAKWTSVDSTEYEIDDDQKNKAHAAGYSAAKESTDGYERDKTLNGINAGGNLAASGAALVLPLIALATKANDAGRAKIRPLMWVAASLNAAVAALYYALKPNKDAKNAANILATTELPAAQTSLYDAQNNMTDASDEVTALTEEADSKNTEANEKMEEDKALFDFYKEQYDALKAKAESGEQLTPDEKALMKQLAPLMEELGEGITETQEDTTETVQGLYDQIEGYQDTYDEAAETVAEVQGVTDYGESFDKSARDNCALIETAMYTNMAASSALALRLSIGGTIFTKAGDLIFTGVAAAAGVASGFAASEQKDFRHQIEAEIDARIDTQDLNTATDDMYGEELDNFVGNMEVVDDLELEVPEDIEVPQEGVPDGGSNGMDPLAAAAAGGANNGNTRSGNAQGGNAPFSPLNAGANNGNAQGGAPFSPLSAGANNGNVQTPFSPSNAGANNGNAQGGAPFSPLSAGANNGNVQAPFSPSNAGANTPVQGGDAVNNVNESSANNDDIKKKDEKI